MVIVTGSVTAEPANFDRVLAGSLEHVHRSRTEPGCLSHAVFVDCENPMRLWFYETWASREALFAHFEVPGSVAFVAMLRELRLRATGPELFDVADPIAAA